MMIIFIIIIIIITTTTTTTTTTQSALLINKPTFVVKHILLKRVKSSLSSLYFWPCVRLSLGDA